MIVPDFDGCIHGMTTCFVRMQLRDIEEYIHGLAYPSIGYLPRRIVGLSRPTNFGLAPTQ